MLKFRSWRGAGLFRHKAGFFEHRSMEKLELKEKLKLSEFKFSPSSKLALKMPACEPVVLSINA